MKYLGNPEYQHDAPAGLGILLLNLGTPDAPTPAAVRRYLAEFLWDPRIIEMPRPLWWLILHGVILRIRPRRSAAAYEKIWTEAGSPLLTITRDQANALQGSLEKHLAGPVKVVPAMRYGSPSIASGLGELRAWGARRVLVLPMYPQYSATTTASTFDAIAQILRGWRWLPELRFINHYHDDAAYIQTLADSVRNWRAGHTAGEKLLFSFHGLPKRYLLAGDPYYCECRKTARLVAENLDLGEDDWDLSFQSRVGREEWLKPYTDHQLTEWAASGVDSVDVICAGFPADCLETLEEIAMQNRDLFLNGGGGHYAYIPALNAQPDHIAMLAALVRRHTQGWPEAATEGETSRLQEDTERTRRLALQAGASQ